MTEEQVQEYADSVVGNIPVGHTGTLDEIAKVVSFLASDQSSYITGIELVVDGGMTLTSLQMRRLMSDYRRFGRGFERNVAVT